MRILDRTLLQDGRLPMAEDGQEDWLGWEEACRREAAIRDMLSRHPKRLNIAVVEAAAADLGISRATLYRLIGRYRQSQTVQALVGPGRGRREGTHILNSEEEALIRKMLDEAYLKPTRPPFQHIVEQIGGACRRKGWPAPTWRTVKARLELIEPRAQALRRKDAEAIQATTPTPGRSTPRAAPWRSCRSTIPRWMSWWSTSRAGSRWGGLGSPLPWMCSRAW